MNNSKTHETYTLSPLQEGMLFHTLAHIGTGVDIEQIICTVNERLDKEAFQRAWGRVVERHAILRSQFEWEGTETGEPCQVVIPAVSFRGECFDWKHLSASEQDERLETYFVKDRAQGFDLGRAPLMRLAVFELGDEAYTFIWTFHHILLDGRAFPLILEEVFTLYEAFVEHRDIEIDQPRPFREYISWVQERDLTKDEKYWRETLSGFTSPTPLVVGSPQSTGKMSLGSEGSVTFRIPAALTSGLRQLAADHGLSMNTLVEGAWALLLSRYSGEEDIVYGTTRSCRRDSVDGADTMIGLLINTVPMRVKVPKQIKVIDWLKQLRSQHTQMRKYIHAPLSDIQKWSDISHGNALFESLVVFENYLLGSYMRSKGGRWADREVEYRGRTNFPLTLIGYNDDELLLRIEFDEERFDLDTIKRMSGHLETILLSIPENLDTSVAMAPLLTEAERRQLLVVWNATQVDYHGDHCLHYLFERQVERTPDATALVFEDQQLTYMELNCRANQLARYLQKLGVGPEITVGIFMERSFEMVIAIYGIIKAGGAYVPLDPEHPSERLLFMADDTQVPVVLTQEHLAAKFPQREAAVVCLDSAWSDIAKEDAQNIAGGATSGNLAYVIYTSGSTGMPKGVMNVHRGICNRLLWMQDAYQLTSGDRVLQKTPYSFDVSVWEFFWPLLVGASLVVARPGGHRDSNYLIKAIQEHQITSLHFVPSMLQIFLEEPDVERCTSLKRVICSGEALPYELQEQFFSRLPAELHNLYGPTEAAVDVTYWPCQRGSARRIVPIGYPVANTQMYILDAYFQPVPIGISGELYIGGVQVARGYLNRPELTAEKFIPDPFSALSEARLYRTGDLARYLPGGEIEYLGRTDHQVKIRGFRIELGEIETVLEEHVSVGQAVVMAREDVPGNKRLVAYMIGAAGQTPSASVLRDHLKERLPEYMVPSAFVPLEKFPLSSNGKVDRKALPVPEYARPELEDAYVAPRTPTEQALAEIWTAVLGVERIGVTDNFFALGGNSLLAVRLFVRVRKWAGIDLPLATLFKSPTIGGLAELLSSSSHKTTGSGEAKSFDVSSLVQQSRCLVPIRPEGKRPPVFLIHAIGGNMLYYFSMLDHLGHDQPVYGLQARGVDGMLPPHTSITAMASHYINEIRSVQPSGPYFMGGASFGGTVAFEIARQLMHQGEDVAFLALLDSIGPGPRGYRHWRDALRWRLSPTKEVDDQTQQITLLLYLLKRTTRFLANRISILKCALCSLSSHQIPLELREVYLTRCHDKAIKSYVPHQYLGPITLFRGPSGNEWPHSDPELGWKNIAKGVFKIIPIPAGHHEFVESVELGNKFAEELKSAQEHSL